jgi:hypothetical protein
VSIKTNGGRIVGPQMAILSDRSQHLSLSLRRWDAIQISVHVLNGKRIVGNIRLRRDDPFGCLHTRQRSQVRFGSYSGGWELRERIAWPKRNASATVAHLGGRSFASSRAWLFIAAGSPTHRSKPDSASKRSGLWASKTRNSRRAESVPCDQVSNRFFLGHLVHSWR